MKTLFVDRELSDTEIAILRRVTAERFGPDVAIVATASDFVDNVARDNWSPLTTTSTSMAPEFLNAIQRVPQGNRAERRADAARKRRR